MMVLYYPVIENLSEKVVEDFHRTLTVYPGENFTWDKSPDICARFVAGRLDLHIENWRLLSYVQQVGLMEYAESVTKNKAEESIKSNSLLFSLGLA